MRVFVKQGKFWLEYYDKKLGKQVTPPTGIDADIPFEKGKPLWWHKSQHKKAIQAKIDYYEPIRLGVVKVEKPLRALTMKGLLERYISEAELNRDEPLSEGSQQSLRNAVKFYDKHLPGVQPKDLTTDIVRTLRAKGKEHLNPRSLKLYFYKLSGVMKYGVVQGVLRVNPFEGVRVKVDSTVPKEIPVDTMLTHLDFLAGKAPKLLGHAVHQILVAGRVNETCSARRVQDEGEIFKYWNSKKRRFEDWPDTPGHRFALVHLFGEDYLCEYRSRNHVIDRLERVARDSGISLTSHDYKRFAVQQAEEQNPPRKILDAIAHHAPVESVMVRRHYSKDRLKQMREVLVESQRPVQEFLERL